MAFLEEHFGEWNHISRTAIACWIAVYVFFIIYALANRSGFLFLDYANLMIHEMGHPLFSWLGYTPMILGGTLLELLVPLACGSYFFAKRELAGVAFCLFWLFENFLYIGLYMADARAQALPLVGSGDHDWAILFGHWRLLAHDRAIGGMTRMTGWAGMMAVIVWLAFHGRSKAEKQVL